MNPTREETTERLYPIKGKVEIVGYCVIAFGTTVPPVRILCRRRTQRAQDR